MKKTVKEIRDLLGLSLPIKCSDCSMNLDYYATEFPINGTNGRLCDLCARKPGWWLPQSDVQEFILTLDNDDIDARHERWSRCRWTRGSVGWSGGPKDKA